MKNKYEQELKNLNFKISVRDYQKLKELSKHNKTSMNQLLRNWIDKYYKKIEIFK